MRNCSVIKNYRAIKIAQQALVLNTHQFNPNNVKHALRQKGYTMTSWAEANGFKFRDVSDVVRGIRHGNYGTGRDIAEKLAAFTSSQAA